MKCARLNSTFIIFGIVKVEFKNSHYGKFDAICDTNVLLKGTYIGLYVTNHMIYYKYKGREK